LEHARSEDGAAGLETDPAADVEESDGREPAGAEADDTTIRHQDTVDLTPLPGFDEPPAPRSEQGTSSPETPQEPQERQPRKPAKSAKNKRAAMPSWDEIVFGSKNDGAHTWVRSSGTHASAEVREPCTPTICRADSGRPAKASTVQQPRPSTSTSGTRSRTRAGTAIPAGPSRADPSSCCRLSKIGRAHV